MRDILFSLAFCKIPGTETVSFLRHWVVVRQQGRTAHFLSSSSFTENWGTWLYQTFWDLDHPLYKGKKLKWMISNVPLIPTFFWSIYKEHSWTSPVISKVKRRFEVGSDFSITLEDSGGDSFAYLTGCEYRTTCQGFSRQWISHFKGGAR